MNKKEEVLEGFAEVFNKRAWLDKVKMEKALAGYAASEVHCIEFIGKHKYPNVTKMAESMYMTRGAISKLTKKCWRSSISRVIKKRIIRKRFISN